MSGCKDDEKVEPEKSIERWVENENYTGRNKVQLNSKSFDDAMYTYGVGYYTVYKKNENVKNYIISENSFSILKRPPLNRELFIQVLEQFVLIGQGDLAPNFNLSFDMLAFDSTFFQFEFISYVHNECILTNELNQVLIAYRGKTNSENKIKYVLLTVDDNRTKLDSEPISAHNSLLGISCWSEVNNNFYVSDGESTYKIKPDGSSKLVFDRALFRMFEHADIVWSVGLDGLVFYSKDNGDSWLRFGESENFYWSKLNFRQINNEVIAYFKYQIYHFIIEEDDAGETMINAREIVSDGLESNEITSISFFDKKYYVTTFSGVFTKSEESFFTYVE
jgi:hypothetical protein